MKVSDLRNAFETGRPLVEQSLSVAVQMAALRTWCREREVDWQQVKSLLKAQIQDAEEGTDKRVKAILEKADNATAYAETLGLGSPEKNISRAAPQQAPAPAQKPVERTAPISTVSFTIAPTLENLPRNSEMPDMPAFPDRRASQ